MGKTVEAATPPPVEIESDNNEQAYKDFLFSQRRGRRGTIITGPQGLNEDASVAKPLLGSQSGNKY